MRQSMSKDPKVPQEMRPKPRQMGGYPAIEALIRNDDFKAARESFAEAEATLDSIVLGSNGFSRRSQAKKVARACALSIDLLSHLFQVKQSLIAKQHAAEKAAGASGLGKRI